MVSMPSVEHTQIKRIYWYVACDLPCRVLEAQTFLSRGCLSERKGGFGITLYRVGSKGGVGESLRMSGASILRV